MSDFDDNELHAIVAERDALRIKVAKLQVQLIHFRQLTHQLSRPQNFYQGNFTAAGRIFVGATPKLVL